MNLDRILLYTNFVPSSAKETCYDDDKDLYENVSILVSSFMQQNEPWCKFRHGLNFYEMQVLLTELEKAIEEPSEEAAVV